MRTKNGTATAGRSCLVGWVVTSIEGSFYVHRRYFADLRPGCRGYWEQIAILSVFSRDKPIYLSHLYSHLEVGLKTHGLKKGNTTATTVVPVLLFYQVLFTPWFLRPCLTLGTRLGTLLLIPTLYIQYLQEYLGFFFLESDRLGMTLLTLCTCTF